MAESLWQALIDLNDFAKILLLSMVPVTELRATIPLAIAFDIPIRTAFFAAFLGSIIPAPFIIILMEPVYRWLSRQHTFAKIFSWFYYKKYRNQAKIERYGLWGLLFFVAVPLPGTGVWTGSFLASIFRLPLLQSLAVISAGAFMAAVIVTTASVGIFKMAAIFSWPAIIAVLVLLLVITLYVKKCR